MDASVLAAIGAPIATAVMAGLGFWLREVRQRRNRTLMHERVVKQAQEQIDFIEKWLQTHQQVSSPEEQEQARKRARQDLQRAYSLVGQSAAEVRRTSEPVTLRKVLQTLLLLGPEQNYRAKRSVGLAILYYCSLAWALVCTGGSAALAFGDFGSSQDQTSEYAITSTSERVALGVCCLSAGLPIAILPAWLLHRGLAWQPDSPGWYIPPQSDITRPPPAGWRAAGPALVRRRERSRQGPL